MNTLQKAIEHYKGGIESTNLEKQALSDRISEDIKRFKASGGKVTKLKTGVFGVQIGKRGRLVKGKFKT